MNEVELKRKLRRKFRDEHSIQWSDSVLDSILHEAKREYALYSGRVTDSFEVITDSRSVYTLPDNFFQVIAVYDENGYVIPVVSFRHLAEQYGDFRKHKGNKAQAVCFNFDGFGKFRIFPQLPPGIKVGKVIYKTLPSDNERFVNMDAVEQHAVFQMYQFMGKSMAQKYLMAFMDMVYRERRQGVEAGGKNTFRTGVYF